MEPRMMIVLGVAGVGLLVLGYHVLFGKAPSPHKLAARKKGGVRPGDFNDLTPTEPSPEAKIAPGYSSKDHPTHPDHPDKKDHPEHGGGHGKHS